MNKSYEVLENTLIAKNIYQMKLLGDTSKITNPGQFINIKIGDGLTYFLRRPISILEYNEDTITIIYKILGEGTKALSKYQKGDYLDILCGLGNGYTVKIYKKQLLIGGGIGIPPLYGLAKELRKRNLPFDVCLGFNTNDDLFYLNEFKNLADNVYVSTMDGSYGFKGNLVELIKAHNIEFDYYYACGPEKMLEALIREKYLGQLSFEERMGCGFGACMGCSKKTIQGYKRICKEGPVLESTEVYLDE